MRRALAVLACGALLAGCSSGTMSPADRLQDKTATVVEQANAKDLAALMNATSDMRAEVQAQQRAGQITDQKAAVLLKLLAAIERDAPLVEATPTPSASPTPSPTASPTPSPTASPTPSPTPSPTKSPTPSPTPAATTPPPILPTLGAGTPSGSGSAPPAAPAAP